MKLISQQKERVNTDELCVGCGNSMHWGPPFLLETYNSICFNGILVEVTEEELKKFKKSIEEYEAEYGSATTC